MIKFYSGLKMKEIYFLILLYSSLSAQETPVSKLQWENGDASTNYSVIPCDNVGLYKSYDIPKTIVCTLNPKGAMKRCKSEEGRVPTLEEFEEAYNSDKKYLITWTTYPYYWVKKGKKYVTIDVTRVSLVEVNSPYGSVRCVWDKKN